MLIKILIQNKLLVCEDAIIGQIFGVNHQYMQHKLLEVILLQLL